MGTEQRLFPEGTDSAGKFISAIYRHLQIIIAAELEPFRIGSGQFIFLLTIAEKEGMTQKALSEELLIDKTTTAKAISKLEREGYVRRTPSPNDQRFNELYLSAEGKKIVPLVKQRLMKLVEMSRKGMSAEEYALLLRLLKKMLNNLCYIVQKGDHKS